MSRRLISLHRRHLRKSVTLLFVTSMLMATAGVYAQDAVRPSLAGQEASDAREQDVSRINTRRRHQHRRHEQKRDRFPQVTAVQGDKTTTHRQVDQIKGSSSCNTVEIPSG